MIKWCRLTPWVRQGKIAQSTNKSLFTMVWMSLFSRELLSWLFELLEFSVVWAKIITLILILRIIRFCRIVRLFISFVALVLHSFSTNSFEVTVFSAIRTITLLLALLVAVPVESLTIYLLLFGLIRFRNDTLVAAETLQIVWILLSV